MKEWVVFDNLTSFEPFQYTRGLKILNNREERKPQFFS